MNKAVGLLEWRSIAQGIRATDTLLKTALVELYQAGSVCPGKFIALFGGEVGAVQSALEAAKRDSGGEVIDELLLAKVDPAVFPALTGTTEARAEGALGILETFTAAAAVRAADTAVKAAAVNLIEVRVARGMGGKGVVLFSGEVGAVKAAAEAAVSAAASAGLLVGYAVIPAPHKDLWGKLL